MFACSLRQHHSWDNIALVKTLCNVVLEAPDNNEQEKVHFNFNVVLILVGQHCTSKNLVQRCPRGSRQQFTRESPMQCCLNTLRKTLHRKNLVQYCLRGSRQHCTGKNPVQCRLSNIWSLFSDIYFGPNNFLIITGCFKWCANIVQILPTLHKKNPGPTTNKKTRLHGTD